MLLFFENCIQHIYFYYTPSFSQLPHIYQTLYSYYLLKNKTNKQKTMCLCSCACAHTHTHVHSKKREEIMESDSHWTRIPEHEGFLEYGIRSAQSPFINKQCQNTSNIYNSLQVACKKITPAVVLIFLGRMIDFFLLMFN